ncbi:hypothetical protein D0T84_20595 [Dysgonomonas sp. 521]|uniref:hypothetical protein n=1 Tax=Dysgonomonas sp. 521 TaxID=2302932 RepID=UPI0013D5ECCF|nr:hypothetical protein [Dysgonomonas sp. 521]NDV97281.1 hypothetical protein [Dysgonomonas sp. 521]
MAAVPRFYKNQIAEGRGILIFSIIFSILLRILFATSFDESAVDMDVSGGYLWQLLSAFSGNSLYSLIGSSVIVGSMAMSVVHINTDSALIRRRTLLPPAIIILLFSCHPSLIWISPAYIGVLFMLLVVSLLFSSYNDSERSLPAFKITFILSLGSLFTPVLLVYIPLMWLGLIIMRCFDVKSLLTSIFGFFIIYFPVFSFYLFTDNLNEFQAPFLSGSNVHQLIELPFLNYNAITWTFLGIVAFLLGIIITDNYINRHKDKIRIRACLSLLTFVTLVSLLLSVFLNVAPIVNLYISLGVGSLLLAHFFALPETKGTVILFYTYSIFYFLFCVLSFLSVV